MKKIFSSLVIVGVFSACVGMKKKNTTCCFKELPEQPYIGVNYLENKYIKAIASIKEDKQRASSVEGMVFIKGGVFDMGGDLPENWEQLPSAALPQQDEFPKHKVRVDDFYMDETEVTIGEFLAFVTATGYKTVAESPIDWKEMQKQLGPTAKKPSKEKLKGGGLVFVYPDTSVSKDNLANWWKFQTNISWRNPDGKNKKIEEILQLPVTQVSWYDAMAYAKWVGKRLPTEAEFEYAMRAGRNNTVYTWGNELIKGNKKQGNFLQGEFPYKNTAEDGYEFLSPVKSFPPNAYGLYDIAGNAWEWTSDWYADNYYTYLLAADSVAVNPKGPENLSEYFVSTPTKVIRGGSFLCSDSWCSGYRNSRRMRTTPDTGIQHLGFRLVKSAK